MVTERRLQRLEEAAGNRISGISFAFENLSDPHNGAAAVRTFEGLGFEDIWWVGHESPLINAQVAKGARKWTRNLACRDSTELKSRCTGNGTALWVSTLSGSSVDLRTWSPAVGPTCFVFGNEHHGVSQQMTEDADVLFHLPLYGMIQSYNLSVAAAITAWQLRTVLDAAEPGWWQENQEQTKDRIDRWLK